VADDLDHFPEVVHDSCWIQHSICFDLHDSRLLLSIRTGQYGASLEGTVTDKSGAVVAGATVTVTNQATGVSRNTSLASLGFIELRPCPWSIPRGRGSSPVSRKFQVQRDSAL